MSDKFISTKDKPVAFLTVSDRRRAKDFYVGKLGLTVIYEDDFALVLDLGITSLRISEIKGFVPQQFTVLGWEVTDIVASANKLASLNIKPKRYDALDQDKKGVWNSPSTAVKILWFEDPDGNILSLSESVN